MNTDKKKRLIFILIAVAIGLIVGLGLMCSGESSNIKTIEVPTTNVVCDSIYLD